MTSRSHPRATAAARPRRAPHPPRPTALSAVATPLAFAARAAATVVGLRVDPDGGLREVAVPLRATRWALAVLTDTVLVTCGPAGAHAPGLVAEALDHDLTAWSAPESGGRHNPVASETAAMFGRPGPLHGPVVFTGRGPAGPDTPAEQVADISVAAVILLAGTATDIAVSSTTVSGRAQQFARLGIHITDPATDDPAASPEPDGQEVYDPARHTVTRGGGWPRCAACEQITVLGHDEHHPDQADPDQTGPVARRGSGAGEAARRVSSVKDRGGRS